MFKKIVVLILLFCLSGCGGSEDIQEEVFVNEEEYIDPLNDIFIFGELDRSEQDLLKQANGGREMANYQFRMMFKDIFSRQLTSIEGETVVLSEMDQLCIEVVSVDCSHCRKQLSLINEFIEASSGTFIQYFNVGDAVQIREMYAQEGVEIPKDLIIIAHDDRFDDYLRFQLGIRSYPTMLFFKQDELKLCISGESETSAFTQADQLAFTDQLSEEHLKQIISLNRTADDVKADLSEQNKKLLEELDNDDYTCELTYQLLGKKADYAVKGSGNSGLYVNEVADFDYYRDKKVVAIYTYLRDNSETDKVKFINSLIDHEADVEYLIVLIEGMESSSAAYRNMNIRFECPVVSVLSAIPDDLFSFGIAAYPSAVFVDRGVFTGAYSNIQDKEKMAEAQRIFLSEESIAYKRNN